MRRAAGAALLSLALLLSGASTLWAVADPDCPDPAGHEQEIVNGEVLIKLTDFEESAAKEGCVMGFIPAPPQTVMAILRDAGKYDEYMPKVSKSEASPASNGAILNAQELDLPWPIGDRHFTVRLVEEQSKDGSFWLKFTYVPGSGNIKDTRGHWLIEPWQGGSRVSYALWSDPGGAIPKWALNRASRRTLPEVVTALRDRVRELAPTIENASTKPTSSGGR